MRQNLFLACLVAVAFLSGCIIDPNGGNAGGAKDWPSADLSQKVEQLKDPNIVFQEQYYESFSGAGLADGDEALGLLEGAKELGFENFLGAVKSVYSDGKSVIVAMLQNNEGKTIFLERYGTENSNKSMLVYYVDEEHYTVFDAFGGMRREGEEFFLLEQSDVGQISFGGSAGKKFSNPGSVLLSPAFFAYCEEKEGGFWKCIWNHKGELGFSILGAIATCAATVAEVPLNLSSLGALTPLQVASLLGCIGSVGSTGVVIYECVEKLIDNSPAISSYSQVTGACYSCKEGKRWQMSEVTMNAVVEDDRLPDSTWLTPPEVKECGEGEVSYYFQVQDCGGNIGSKEETITAPPGKLALAQCASGDNCCPTGCSSANDSDCSQVCGNAVAEGTEECDLIDFRGQTCETLGFAPGALRCTDCKLYTQGCGNCRTDSECSDDNACTADTCVDFTCTNTQVDGCCTQDSQCSDSNACTTDTCSESNSCSNAPFTLTPTSNAPQQGTSCTQCSAGFECKQDLYASSSSGCCPEGYCLADSFCHSPCTLVSGKTCKNGTWE